LPFAYYFIKDLYFYGLIINEYFFANFVLDIAKYITTAMIITGALGAIEYGWVYYAVSIAIVICMVVLGFVLIDDKPDKEKNVEQ